MKLSELLEELDDSWFAGSVEGLEDMHYRGKTFLAIVRDCVRQANSDLVWDPEELKVRREGFVDHYNQSVHPNEDQMTEKDWNEDHLRRNGEPQTGSDLYLRMCTDRHACMILDLQHGIIYLNMLSKASIEEGHSAYFCIGSYDVVAEDLGTISQHNHSGIYNGVEDYVKLHVKKGQALDLTDLALSET